MDVGRGCKTPESETKDSLLFTVVAVARVSSLVPQGLIPQDDMKKSSDTCTHGDAS